MPTAKCPECEERIHIKADSVQGDKIICEDCDAELELVGLDPMELDPWEGSPGDDFDDEDEMDDVFEADDEEDGFESGQSQVGFMAPGGAATAAPVEAPWGTAVTSGVVIGSLFSVVGAFAGFELVRTMWLWFQPAGGESSFLQMIGGLFN